MERSIFFIRMSGKPSWWVAILDLAVSEILLATQLLNYVMGDHLGEDFRLPHRSQFINRKGPFRGSTGSSCGDRALRELLYQRIADALSTLPGTMTAVHLGKRHIHQALDDLLDWMCAKLLDGRPSALAVLVTPQGIQVYRLTPAGPDPQPLTSESIPCTTSQIELLLTPPQLVAYECYRRRSSPPGMASFRI